MGAFLLPIIFADSHSNVFFQVYLIILTGRAYTASEVTEVDSLRPRIKTLS